MSAVVKRYVTGAYTECFQFANKNLTLKSSWEIKVFLQRQRFKG